MAVHATPELLEAYATSLDLPAPDNTEALLEAASRDIDRLVGRGIVLDQLPDGPRAALARGTCAQALFRAEQGPDGMLGADDGIAAVPGVSFSLRPIPRLSPLAIEELAGWGLLARSGCALPDPEPVTSDGLPD